MKNSDAQKLVNSDPFTPVQIIKEVPKSSKGTWGPYSYVDKIQEWRDI